MDSQEHVEITTLTFKSHNPPDLTSIANHLKAVPGVKSLLFGQQIEHPSNCTLITLWSSPSAQRDFTTSEAYTSYSSHLRDIVEGHSSIKINMIGNLQAALSAPCTEFFSAYGVDIDFCEKGMKPFAEGVDKGGVPNYHGSAYGEFENSNPLRDHPSGPSVAIVLGWDSKEAHLAQRGDGKGK